MMNTNQHEIAMQNRKQFRVTLSQRLGPLWLLIILIALCWGSVSPAQAQKNETQAVKTDLTPGFVLIGDIQVPAERVLRPEAIYATNLWTTFAVPYEFDSNVSPANQSAMLAAIVAWEGGTYVGFQPCPNNSCAGTYSNYVHIQNSSKNNSAVGMVLGQQIINIVSWESTFTMAHELGHCLGLWHEHTRLDRDTYVTINTANIQSGFANQFTLNSSAPTYGAYDFDSVMHYDKCSFSTDCSAGATCNCAAGTETITVLSPYTSKWQDNIGQRTHLSDGDQAAISFLYLQRFLDCDYDGSNGASNGKFRRPYTSFATAVSDTPAGGTVWILRDCNFHAPGTYSNQVTVKTAPGVIATVGS